VVSVIAGSAPSRWRLLKKGVFANPLGELRQLSIRDSS